jgi:hypothetical protein
MKKIVLSASLVALSLFAKAQDATSEHKPVLGDVTTEFSYGGIFNNTQLGLANGQLKFRYFVADNLAARIGFNISSNSKTDHVLGNDDEVGTSTESTSNVGFNLGVEKHFSGSERLSTYAGADLLLQLNSESQKLTDTDYTGSNYVKGTSGKYKTGSTGLGLRLVTGADYYIVKKVYLGGELGWGFLYTIARDTKVNFKNGSTTIDEVSPAEEGARTFEVKPSVVGAIRLGFRF